MLEAKQLFFGPFRLDPTNECLWRGEKEIRLHPKAFGLLRYLLDHPGQMVTKESLLETMWPGVHVTEAILSVYVAEIRKALGEDPKKPVFIETLHPRGYRFVAPVTIDHQPGRSQSMAGSEELIRPIMREAATAIGAEPIVGREKALSFLLEKLEAALHGTGSVVFTTGPAGIGKTRLVRELRLHAARCGFQWFGGKYEKSANHPNAAWVDMLKGYLQQKDATSLHVLIGPYTAQLARIVPEVMPRENSTSSVEQEDSKIERTRLLEAWTHLFVQISTEAPLVLFLDDVQWAGSLELLHHLASNIGNQRLLALVAYRDDELKMNPSPWKTVLAMNRERLFHPLPLEPLEQKEVAQLISQKLEKTIAPHLVDVVYQRTQGNPFFVEEFLRLLQDCRFSQIYACLGIDYEFSLPALIAIGSYLAPEVEENYILAEKLCKQLGEASQLFPVLWTLSRIRNWRGELLAARQLAEQLLSLARREQDSLRLLEAHHTLWAISLDIGELPSTKGYAEQGFMLYDRLHHGQLGSVYGGHDPGVCSRIHAAKALWLLGYPDQALQTIEAELAMATELSHPYTSWLALMAAIWIHHHRGDRQAAQDHVEKLLVLATEQQHRRWMKVANFLQGWLIVEQGQWERGITQMRQGESELLNNG